MIVRCIAHLWVHLYFIHASNLWIMPSVLILWCKHTYIHSCDGSAKHHIVLNCDVEMKLWLNSIPLRDARYLVILFPSCLFFLLLWCRGNSLIWTLLLFPHSGQTSQGHWSFTNCPQNWIIANNRKWIQCTIVLPIVSNRSNDHENREWNMLNILQEFCFLHIWCISNADTNGF